MKDRQKELIKLCLESDLQTISSLMSRLNISRRTLYYDIEDINKKLCGIGEITNLNGSIVYLGDYESALSFLRSTDKNNIYQIDERRKLILKQILLGGVYRKSSIKANEYFSNSTIATDLKSIRKTLHGYGLKLNTNGDTYAVEGEEYKVRKLFLEIVSAGGSFTIREDVSNLSNELSLGLTQYSLSLLSVFTGFVRERIDKGYVLPHNDLYKHNWESARVEQIFDLLAVEDNAEANYYIAFITSLPVSSPTICDRKASENVKAYLEYLISEFEMRTSIEIRGKDQFKSNIFQHLLSSYYRILYQFPINNPSLLEIKERYKFLFNTLKDISERNTRVPEFDHIADEEIAFIAAYFGSHIYSQLDNNIVNKVLVVCHHGTGISQILQQQIKYYLPQLDIVSTVGVKDIDKFDGLYSYIISTIDLPEYESVIRVEPFLSDIDIQVIMNKCFIHTSDSLGIDIEKIISLVAGSCEIKTKSKLRKDLTTYFYGYKIRTGKGQLMLTDMLTPHRIQSAKSVGDWKEAIKLASKPILDDGSITSEYVDAMISAVEELGPYIVLMDHFALPHAKSNKGVNEPCMAFLALEEETDLLGKPVRGFLVLATVDNYSHLEALGDLSSILCEPENMSTFLRGQKDSIMSLISKNRK